MQDKLKQLRGSLIKKAKKQVKEKYAESDVHIIRAVSVLGDLDAAFNLLAENCVEWYSAHFPELGKIVRDNEKFLRLVYEAGGRKGLSEKKAAEVLGENGKCKEVANAAKKSMGSKVKDPVMGSIRLLALNALNIREERKTLLGLLEKEMGERAPNTGEVAGHVTGARLLAAAGSLRALAFMPASTIQVLGAEKALFRHLRNRRVKGPKHGILYQHAMVRKAPARHKGKVARSVAAKIAIAAKADFFGEGKRRVAGRLQEELEQRLKQLE